MNLITAFALYNIIPCVLKLSKWYLGYNESTRNNTTEMARNSLSEVVPNECYSPVTVNVRKWPLLACLAFTQSNILMLG